VAIFHGFRRPPYGGSNQFFLALRRELRDRGLVVGANRIGPRTRACLLDSGSFDLQRLLRQRRTGCRVVHRIDGPVALYRGRDDGSDERIAAINQRVADATVLQSHYSRQAHESLGQAFRNPVVIMNTPDPLIFHPGRPRPPLAGRRVRLIATSWSMNPNKGAATFAWLDEHLDWERYELTFVGRSSQQFTRIRMVDALPSERLADELRAHDVYLAASLLDPCSNALLEALACGLPAVYARSGGHPEIVGEAGFGFESAEEIPALLDHLCDEYEARRTRIAIPTLADVANGYLAAMGLTSEYQASPGSRGG
jgi:glycosyltransferase involved in cell wall biosynthesis